jgi:hypothetical protein
MMGCPYPSKVELPLLNQRSTKDSNHINKSILLTPCLMLCHLSVLQCQDFQPLR